MPEFKARLVHIASSRPGKATYLVSSEWINKMFIILTNVF